MPSLFISPWQYAFIEGAPYHYIWTNLNISLIWFLTFEIPLYKKSALYREVCVPFYIERHMT